MKLIQARTRGITPFTESSWFDLGPHLNLFQFPKQSYGATFLRILQTINPTYAIKSVKPFSEFPQFIEQRGHTRRVDPAKRTVALGVFSATPELVRDLASLDNWLYETDRIEIGRRLDYSRWTNFVELASSTRWSEISQDINFLVEQSSRFVPQSASPIIDICNNLKPEDRIKNEVQDSLVSWLRQLPAELLENQKLLIKKTITAVMRADHFQTARQMVQRRLPLFVFFSDIELEKYSSKKKITTTQPPNFKWLHNLPQLIENTIRTTENDQSAAVQRYVDAMNRQLSTMQDIDFDLRLENSLSGLKYSINNKPLSGETIDPAESFMQLQAEAWLAIAFSRLSCTTEPIFLFAGPELTLPKSLHTHLAEFVSNISRSCQCLYSFSDIDIFSTFQPDRRFTAAELQMGDG